MSIRNQCDNTVAQTIKDFSRVGIFVNNGGVVFGTRFTGIASEEYNAVLDINVGLHIH